VILLVDDDPTSLRLLEMILRRGGEKVATFFDPRAALEYARRTGGIKLIISDVRMPGLNGLDFVEEIRKIPAQRFTPVILCTGVGDAETVRAAIERGVRDYIVKPIDPTIVIRKVRSIMLDVSPVMEGRGETNDRLGLDDRDYRDLAQGTLPSMDGLIEELEIALERSDAAAALDVAIRISEPASVFVARRVLEVILHVQRAPDAATIIEKCRILVREASLFRATLQLSVEQMPLSAREPRSITYRASAVHLP
jgi:CheY-like chemotaxis protein